MPFRFLQRHATLFMATSLFVGLLLQDLAAFLRPAVFPLATITMMLPLLRMDWAQVHAHARRPLRAFLIGAGAMLVCPLIVWHGALALGLDTDMSIGMTLVAGSPPLMSGPAYAVFLGLDAALAIVVSIPWTLISPLVVPPWLYHAVGIEAEVPASAFALRMGAMVGGAFVGAWLLGKLWPALRQPPAVPYLDGLTVLTMCTFGIGLTDGLTEVVMADPAKALVFTAVATGLCAGLQLVGALSSAFLGAYIALTVGLLTGARNIILVTGAVFATASPDLVLYMICSQLPLYVMPALQKPICGLLLERERRRKNLQS